jgi:toxin ParE1/3/4
VVRYRLSAEAQDDLDAIGDYILQDNPARAASFIDELISRFARIAERPRTFRARDELMPGLRSAAHGNYLIFFRIEGNLVKIIRVLHGARDLPKLLKQKQ